MKAYTYKTLAKMLKDGRVEFVTDPRPDWGVIRWSRTKKVEVVKIR